MLKAAGWILAVGVVLGATQAQARTVAIGGVAQARAVDSRTLGGGEMLAVWTLPRLGVQVRNDPQDLRLLYGARELRYDPVRGWRSVGFRLTAQLPAPQTVNGSLFVPLSALRLLGIRVLQDAPDVLDFAAPAVIPVTTLPPSPDPAPSSPPAANSVPASTPPNPFPLPPVSPIPTTSPGSAQPGPNPPGPNPSGPTTINLNTVRVSRTLHRTVEVQRVVLELSAAAPYTVSRDKAGLSLTLGGVGASASSQTLHSGDTLSVTPGAAGTVVRLGSGGGTSEIFALDNPPRVVVDTTTVLDSSVPPPIDPDSLPPGVSYQNRGGLHLLSFDPARYQPRVVSALPGQSSDIASLVRGAGGIAGVNGGYFDTRSGLPVDLVVSGGLMTAPSLERRATVGFRADGSALFGYPRPRYVLSGPFGNITVNTVGARVRPELLCAFVGDGKTAVGGDNLTTLYLAPGGSSVQSALSGRVIPPLGTLALTFDPARFPQLPRAAGQPLGVQLSWRSDDAPWNTALDALSAGPLLVAGGKPALNPEREMFDTGASIWRATRQVAVGTLNGQPTLAYFEHGTPEAFASALAAAGVQDAVRMDSGSSASVYLSSGYGNLGGYLNTVWGQNVPNAVVLVPKKVAARK